MKKLIFLSFVYLCSAISTSLMGIDFTDKYSREELVAARTAWLGQEDRIDALLWEAKNIAKDQPVQYLNGCDYVANIDATTETIETFLKQGKSISLSYQQFHAFISDDALFNDAVQLYLQQGKAIKKDFAHND